MGHSRESTAKMRASHFVFGAVCLVYYFISTTEATVALTVGALALTAAQTTALVGLGALVAAKKVGIGYLAGRAAARSGSRSRYSRHRGRRREDDIYNKQEELSVLLDEEVATVDRLAALEPDQCFKRVFCSAATGSLNNPALEKTLNLVVEAIEVDPINVNTNKFSQAALFWCIK